MASRGRNAENSAKKSTYLSPLDRLSESTKTSKTGKSTSTKSRSTSVSKVSITSKPKEMNEKVFPTKLIPLDNGIEQSQRYDEMPTLLLPSPPLPQVSPPRALPPAPPPAPAPTQAPAAQGKAEMSMQDMLL